MVNPKQEGQLYKLSTQRIQLSANIHAKKVLTTWKSEGTSLSEKTHQTLTENESSAGSGELKARLRSIMYWGESRGESLGESLGCFFKTKCERHLVHQGYILSVSKY